MANEALINVTFQATKNGVTVNPGLQQKQFNMVGNDMLGDTQLFSNTVSAALTWGSITGAPQKVLLINLDPVNFITIAGDSGLTQFVQKIPPDDFIVLSPVSATVYAKADTAPCELFKAAFCS